MLHTPPAAAEAKDGSDGGACTAEEGGGAQARGRESPDAAKQAAWEGNEAENAGASEAWGTRAESSDQLSDLARSSHEGRGGWLGEVRPRREKGGGGRADGRTSSGGAGGRGGG